MKVNRSTTYYKPDGEKTLEGIARHEKEMQDVKEAYEEGKGNYGSRQVKNALSAKGTVMGLCESLSVNSQKAGAVVK